MGSNPHCGDHFSCTIHLDQSMKTKIEWKLPWHCCICCNYAKGRVDFEDSWLIKSSFIRMKWKACQLTRTKFPQKKIICIWLEKFFFYKTNIMVWIDNYELKKKVNKFYSNFFIWLFSIFSMFVTTLQPIGTCDSISQTLLHTKTWRSFWTGTFPQNDCIHHAH